MHGRNLPELWNRVGKIPSFPRGASRVERYLTKHSFQKVKGLSNGIRIIDLDVDLTQPSQEAPGFHRLYLKLSQEPPNEWVKIFENERRFPPHRIWRNAWVLGPHIVVECIPEELEQFQLNHLKEDVANTNKKFSEWAAKNHAETLQTLGERAEYRKKLEELRAKLEFD